MTSLGVDATRRPRDRHVGQGDADSRPRDPASQIGSPNDPCHYELDDLGVLVHLRDALFEVVERDAYDDVVRATARWFDGPEVEAEVFRRQWTSFDRE